MHSMFLPGQLLPALDDAQEGALYHVLLTDGSIGTVQRRSDLWNWRKLTAGNSVACNRSTSRFSVWTVRWRMPECS
jgi:hypothetical protein